MTVIQRFGSAANLNIHLHCLVLDGVYRCGADGQAVFIEAGAPSDEQIHAVLQTVIARLMERLTKQGALVQDLGETWLAEIDADGEGEEARTLRPLQAAALTWRIAFGPRAGHKVVTRRGAPRREAATGQRLCADIDGFSLHAAVRCEAHERDRLEYLCPIGRLAANAAASVEAAQAALRLTSNVIRAPGGGVGEGRAGNWREARSGAGGRARAARIHF